MPENRQDKCWAATATWMTSLRRELVGPSSITARRSGGQAKLATQKVAGAALQGLPLVQPVLSSTSVGSIHKDCCTAEVAFDALTSPALNIT